MGGVFLFEWSNVGVNVVKVICIKRLI